MPKTGSETLSLSELPRLETAPLLPADAPFTDDERARIALFSIEGIGPRALENLVEKFRSLAAAARAPRSEAAPVLRDDATRARLLAAPDLFELADRLLERTAGIGARVMVPGRDNWPMQLRQGNVAPVLYVKGTLETMAKRVAIVGSREADKYGLEVTQMLAGSLARAGVEVVSGGAVGIDAAAHKAAFGNQGRTIAVLGSGLDVCYPAHHAPLFKEILARGGALVSLFPPGTPAVPQNFLVRNRVIAGLSDATIVARARRGSGAISTAQAAHALTRTVLAVPGKVDEGLSEGTNLLLESGIARAATLNVGPILQAIGLRPADYPAAAPHGLLPGEAALVTGPQLPPPQLPDELRPVWEALGRTPVQFDELLEKCAIDAPTLANALLRLEVMDLCEERVGKVFVRKDRL